MKRSEMIIRQATAADVESWYGKSPYFSLRAIVGQIEDRVVAIGGVYTDRGVVVGIAGIKEELRARRKDIVRIVRAGQNLLKNHSFVVAFASREEPTADSFIKHLGFEYQGNTANGETYLWNNSQTHKSPEV